MRTGVAILCGILEGTLLSPAGGQGQELQSSLDVTGRITWSSSYTNYLISIDFTTNLGSGTWLPVKNEVTTNQQGELLVPMTNRIGYFKLFAADASLNPPGMVLVPAGTFLMGDNNSLTYDNEKPAHVVYVRAFYIDEFEITNQKTAEMMQWAYNLGRITVDNSQMVRARSGDIRPLLQCKGIPDSTAHNQVNFSNGVFYVDAGRTNHPCVGVSWYGAVTYCNWRSERDGLELCYNLTNWTCDFSRKGYRLPTEAEWEKGARGGQTLHNYPWPSPWQNSQIYISQVSTNMATYTPVGLPHPFRTTPVGYYNATQNAPGPDTRNGYGLYDVVGNVREWCWDWYSATWYSDPGATLNDPTGPAEGDVILFPNGTSGPTRLSRGGSFDENQKNVRCAFRGEPYQSDPGIPQWYHGFRCVKGA